MSVQAVSEPAIVKPGKARSSASGACQIVSMKSNIGRVTSKA